ncbi:MAG: 50S ribosomal protein L9 [Candidatus Paceibacterota bacterium]
MRIILLQDIAKIGKKYEEKNIANGYARNALIPQGKAILATPENRKHVATKKEVREQKWQDKEERLEKALSGLSDEKITVRVKANEKGHLFAGIGKEEISALLKKEGIIDIEPRFIECDGVIKEVGEHSVGLYLGDKKGEIVLRVQAEE